MITLDEGGRGAATARGHGVPRGLRGSVEGIWILPPQRGRGAERWRVVADANPHVVLHRLEGGHVRAVVVGARSRWVDVDQASRSYTIGVRLAVGALPALTRLGARELLDRGVAVADLYGASGRAVTRRLEDAEDPRVAADVLVAFLRRRLEGAGDADWRVRGLMSVLAGDPGATVGRRPSVSASRPGRSRASWGSTSACPQRASSASTGSSPPSWPCAGVRTATTSGPPSRPGSRTSPI